VGSCPHEVIVSAAWVNLRADRDKEGKKSIRNSPSPGRAMANKVIVK
jgi:hypothetical protein